LPSRSAGRLLDLLQGYAYNTFPIVEGQETGKEEKEEVEDEGAHFRGQIGREVLCMLLGKKAFFSSRPTPYAVRFDALQRNCRVRLCFGIIVSSLVANTMLC
jgi:hypothetical protein